MTESSGPVNGLRRRPVLGRSEPISPQPTRHVHTHVRRYAEFEHWLKKLNPFDVTTKGTTYTDMPEVIRREVQERAVAESPLRQRKKEKKKGRSRLRRTNSDVQDLLAYRPDFAEHVKEKVVESFVLTGHLSEAESMHMVRPSLFSSENRNHNSFRGFVNAGLLLLFLSNFRLVLLNFRKYGWRFSIEPLVAFVTEPHSFPTTMAILISISLAYLLSLSLEKVIIGIKPTVFSERVVSALQFALAIAAIAVPSVIIEIYSPHPIGAGFLLMVAAIAFMKLISYAGTNAQLRREYWEERERERERKGEKKVGEEDESESDVSSSAQVHRDSCDSSPSGRESERERERERSHPKEHYPANLNLKNLGYFIAAPTLCYQLNYPRSPHPVRMSFLLRRGIEMILLLLIYSLAFVQYIIPTVENTKEFIAHPDALRLFERLLKLAVPNLLLWLLMFYAFFHVWLNILAEVTRFGDRLFYRDWWNATTIPYFWKAWNIPVHNWMLRHVYFPTLRRGHSKVSATLVVFLLSAVFHEVLVSVPFHMFRMYAFAAMAMQMPLSILTLPLKGRQVGNIIFWLSIFIGQPLCILLYTYDTILYEKALGSE